MASITPRAIMPEYKELRDYVEWLEGVVDNLQIAVARMEGEMLYIRRALDVHERQDEAEVLAALEVRKSGAIERLREEGAQRIEEIREVGAKKNHRRELVLKGVAALIAAIIGAILGS